MRRGSEFVFSRVPTADIPRSAFNRSHTHKTTFNAGYLVPVYVDEVLPGDTFTVNMTCFARLSTPIVPVMDNMYLDVFFFFVPNRLVWSNWQKFMGEQENPDDSTDYLVPQINNLTSGTVLTGTVYDYFGLPVEDPTAPWTTPPVVNALPFRAYNLIWNEWFRSEDLQDSVVVPKTDGPDLANYYTLLRRGKRHDYFTSCLPWPQKGAGVELPLGNTAPVVAAGTGVAGQPTFKTTGAASTLGVVADTSVHHPGPANQLEWVEPKLVADLSSATSATINSLRQAFQIQRLLERDARGGTRYTEILRSHFGVVSPDSRLQRPEYLGGGNAFVHINPVAQTSGSPPDTGGYTTTPQGNLSAFGTVSGSGIGFSKSFVEHGYVIGLVCVRAEQTYQQQLHRLWSRKTRYDFYWPAFAHLGEQAVLKKEMEYRGQVTDEEVFGYQERWAEYRYFPSKVTGKFRSVLADTLDVWHLAPKFIGSIGLNAQFIEENPPVERIVAVPSEPHFLFDSVFQVKCVRPMPTYSVPGYIDHF